MEKQNQSLVFPVFLLLIFLSYIFLFFLLIFLSHIFLSAETVIYFWRPLKLALFRKFFPL